ncbi:hypothetical protein C8J56DRAFT_372776 [Mycena floridula]|nr:hypothetical protein C8J56DRAFT_372776 [Mycena floridula]
MVAPPHYQIQVQFTSTVFVGDSTNIDLRSPKECGLENEAQLIAEMYNEVLNHLFAPGAEQQPGNRRLQYAFAAACAGLSRAEWDAMSTKDKESLRCKYSQSYRTPNHQFALEPPALVVYIGPKRICGNSGSSSVSSSPSVQALSQATGNSEDGEEFTAWDKAWDEAVNTSELPCTWAWHVCSDGARVIFLSGFFALWHGLYKTTKLSDLIIMTTFLKLVLFHELCHATRSVLYGSTHLTPEKCVDAGGPSPTHEDGRMIGDAGRLAEELAFGFVVGLYMGQ